MFHEQVSHEHDLMQCTETNYVTHFVGSEVVGLAHVVSSEVVGMEDDIQHCLDMVLCDYESPRDQNFVGGSDVKRQHQLSTASATASRNRKRQHMPPA